MLLVQRLAALNHVLHSFPILPRPDGGWALLGKRPLWTFSLCNGLYMVYGGIAGPRAQLTYLARMTKKVRTMERICSANPPNRHVKRS